MDVTSRSRGGPREERAKDKARKRGPMKRNGQRPGREWTGGGEGGERHAMGQPRPVAREGHLDEVYQGLPDLLPMMSLTTRMH